MPIIPGNTGDSHLLELSCVSFIACRSGFCRQPLFRRFTGASGRGEVGKEQRRFRGVAYPPVPSHGNSAADPSARLARKIAGRPCVPGRLLQEPGTSGFLRKDSNSGFAFRISSGPSVPGSSLLPGTGGPPEDLTREQTAASASHRHPPEPRPTPLTPGTASGLREFRGPLTFSTTR